MQRRHLAPSPATTKPTSVLLAYALFFGAPAWADPGLGSLEGLWIIYLVGFVLLLLALLAFAFLARIGIRWARDDDPGRMRTGRFIIIVLGIFVLAASTRFIDYSLYLLRDNTHADATTITRAHVERYMETADGRAFYLVDMGLGYFKPGRAIVIRTDVSGQSRVFDIFEASRSMYFRLADKKLWIPIVPTFRDRFPLEDRGPIVLLDRNWHFDDLVDSLVDNPIPWCCEVDWVRMLLERGADPNEATSSALPLYQAVKPLGWRSKKEDVAAIEAVLAQLLAAGVDVNAVNERGDTALHQVTGYPLIRSVDWLLSHGADPMLTNDSGKSSIDLLLDQRKKFGRHWNPDKLDEHQAMIDMMSRSASPRPSLSGTQ